MIGGCKVGAGRDEKLQAILHAYIYVYVHLYVAYIMLSLLTFEGGENLPIEKLCLNLKQSN